MDPYTATREEFTNELADRPIPANASSEWSGQANALKDLLKKLAFHEAMRPNLQQTYMTPANSKNKVYFMWDFVGRTLGMLYQIQPSSTSDTSSNNEPWTDILSRNAMANQLILDTTPGMLNMMIQTTYPGQTGQQAEFGDDIVEAAKKLK